MPSLDLGRLIVPGYWFEGAAGPPTAFTYVVAALFAAALVAGLAVWLRRRQFFPQQRVKTRLAARFGPWIVAFSAVGLLSTLFRAAEVPILSARIIWLAAFVGIVAVLGYVAWYWRTRYPAERARLEREELRRRFLPRPRPERRRRDRRR